MKRTILIFCFILAAMLSSFAQNKKAVRDSIARVNYAKAVAAIELRDFVIIVDSYDTGGGNFETNTDVSNFISYEKEFVILQGEIITPKSKIFTPNSFTNKLEVLEYNNVVDKKGNTTIKMQVRGSLIYGKIEISMRKGFNLADVLITPPQGDVVRFSGEIVPRAESKYFKRSGEI